MTGRLLQDWPVTQAHRRPQATAVVDRSSRTSYAELDARSTQIARMLHAVGCRPGDRVPLWMPKSATAIAALIGIYKAGAIYVPLDPSSPPRRLSTILTLCDSRVLLFAGTATAALAEIAADPVHESLQIGWLDETTPPPGLPVAFTSRDVANASPGPLPHVGESTDAAHILFTSGSTGTPKGVVITHANVIHFIDWTVSFFGLDASDRLSGHPPLHFDLSFLDIFGAFAAGAELHLVPPDVHLMPSGVATFIRDRQLTQWFSVPSVLAYLARFDAVRPGDFPSLRRVMWCGDVLPTPVLQYWMERLPHVEFSNLYGPTETTIASSCYRVPARPEDAGAAVPIGLPCDGEELLVLDDELRETPPDTAGDLYIGGVGLAREYWGDPAQTAAAFRPHPRRPGARLYRTGDLARRGDDGLVYFLGRSDSQVKTRGYRVELGEIETALNTVPGIHESAVVALATDGFEGATICGAFVPSADADLTPARLRQELGQRVPAYMLPSRWLRLEGLPRTANGKTDRRELRRLFELELITRAAHSA